MQTSAATALRPKEQGEADARNKLPNSNPFRPFTQKWKEYNRGFQSAKV